jgi:hypothetical protein
MGSIISIQYLLQANGPHRTTANLGLNIPYEKRRHIENTQQIHRKYNSMDTFYNNHRIQQLLEGYGQWVHDQMAYGWHGYLLSFMFSQIQAPDHERMDEMKKHLGSLVSG